MQRKALMICITTKLKGRKRLEGKNHRERENNTAAYIAMHRKKIILV